MDSYKNVKTFLVGFIDNKNNPENTPILIVGERLLNQSTKIINSFEGNEARELYNKLVGNQEERK